MRFFIPLCLCLFLLCGSVAEARPEKAGQSLQDRFAAMDADKDGKVSREEFFKVHQNMKDAAFLAIDKDADGQISQDEWANFAVGHGKEPGGHPPVEEQAAPAGGSAGGSAPAAKQAPELLMPSGDK